jgi:predicted phosphodiesterase
MSKGQEIKQFIIDDIKICFNEYKEENPSGDMITRDFYRQKGKYKEKEITKYFGSFKALLDEAFKKEEVDIIQYKKKIHILENENKNLKNENQDLIKNSVLEDIILSKYEDRLNLGIFIDNFKDIKINKYINITKNKEAILVLSDFHLGEIVLSSELHGINEYNSEIMIKRLNRIFYYFVHYCKKYEIQKINILLLGDLISGSHHPELMKTQEFSDIECIFFLQEYLTNKILEIEKEFSQIKINILVGNHSRIPEGKPEFKKSAIMNYEYILSKQMKMFFDLIQKDNDIKKIDIKVNESLFDIINVADRKFLITHGHILSNGSNSFAGIPYYGLSQQASKLDGAFKQFEHLDFSDIIMGHLHVTSRIKTPIGNIFVNGSTIGVAEFALYKMKCVGIPEQTMLIIEDGNVNAEIILRGE